MKRKLHDMNWLYKNCELDSHDNYYFNKEHTNCIVIPNMFKYMGKVVTIKPNSYESTWCSIEESGYDWEEWMFEPGEVKE